MDDPNIVLFRSDDNGNTIEEVALSPGNESVFFSSYALSDGPCGTYIFVGGGLFESFGTSSFLGYRINVDTGESTILNLGENLTMEGRTLYADNQGTLVDGYKTTEEGTPGDLVIRFSSDQGNTFEAPIVVATGDSHNIARSPTTDNILVVYEAFGEIFLTVYDDVLKNIELGRPDPDLSFCSPETCDLNFILSGIFSPNTAITAVLSDEFGSFANAVSIGVEVTGSSGIITCTLPDNLVPSDLYRIQLQSLNDCIQSNPIPMIYNEARIDGPNTVCINESIQLTGSDIPNALNPWFSSDSSIATIDNTGLVTGIAPVIVEVTYLNSDDCVATHTVEVANFPTVAALVELAQCDDDNDGMVAFNLYEATPNISANFATETFTFYPSLNDAENNTNAIPEANALSYVNASPSEILGVQTVNSQGCTSYSKIQLTVSVSAIASPGSLDQTIYACDDFLDADGNNTANNNDTDGITNFNFDFVENDVISFFAASQQPFLEVSFYESLSEALEEQNALDPENHRNTNSPFTQTIFVRVDNNLNNACIGLAPLLTLSVETVPNSNVAEDLLLCDNPEDGDAFNGIVQNFDLTVQNTTILGSQNPANHLVTYHTSATDAQQGINAIPNPTAFENSVPNQQTIFVRVENMTTNCFHAHASFDLIVAPWAEVNTVPDLELCDDNSDGSAQNGFVQTFDLESQTSEILGTQNPNQYEVSYHASLEDAQLGVLPLLSPFSNSVPYAQTIYVRVSNVVTNCPSDVSTFDVIVNSAPAVQDISNLSYCDDDFDGYVSDIDLDSQIGVLLGTLDPANFRISFHNSQENASSGNNPLSSPYSNTQPNEETIFVRLENTITGCVNDQYTFKVIINPLPVFSVNTPQFVCLNDVPKSIGIENPSTIYDYVWTTPSGEILVGPEIQIREGGNYSVEATTTDGTECSFQEEIFVNEFAIANLTTQDIEVIDNSDNNSIRINTNNLGIGQYEFALENENGVQTLFQDEPFFENLVGDIYTILVRDKNGCGTNSTLSVPVIQFPKFFTPNNDLQNDTWRIKGASSQFYPGSKISIYDRYGKLVASLDIDGPGWDGTYNSRILPSDDYWFSVLLIGSDEEPREFNGNFSLLRK
jgi:gliding motility-associated-like protein